MIKYLIFDFDGTLVDSKEVFISTFNNLASKHKFESIHAGNIEYLQNLSVLERFKFLKVPLYKFPLLSASFIRLYKTSIGKVKLLDGIRELFCRLEEQGIQIAIISSNSKDNIRRFVLQNEIANIKDIFCSSNLFGKDKLINSFLKSKKLNSDEVIYVGDEVRDIVACKRINVKVIGVCWGYDKSEILALEKPDFLIRKPEEILEVLRRYNTCNTSPI